MAALAPAAEPGRAGTKAIHQNHLDEGIRDVVAGKRVMRQSLFDPAGSRFVDRKSPSPITIATVAAFAALLLSLAALIAAFVR